MDYKEFVKKLKEWNGAPNYHKHYIVVIGGKKISMRMFYSDTYGPCEYRKRSKRFGWAMTQGKVAPIEDFYPAKRAIDLADRLQKVCKRAVSLMEVSGLWPDRLKCFKAIASASREEVEDFLGEHGSASHEHRDVWMKARGVESCAISCDEVCGLLDKGVVSIPYPKEKREFAKELMRSAILEKREERYYWRGSYDYSVHTQNCNDGKMRAWYSAEYKNCGNGHYYLMIDESHAFHCEDD